MVGSVCLAYYQLTRNRRDMEADTVKYRKDGDEQMLNINNEPKKTKPTEALNGIYRENLLC